MIDTGGSWLRRASGGAYGAAVMFAASPARAADDTYGDAAEGGTLPQLDFSTWASQIFWLLITFGVLYYVLSRVALPRIGGIIEDRHDKIADDLDDAAHFQRQAEAAQETYERTLADARARAGAIAAETKADLDAQVAEATARADAEASERTAAAEGRIRAAADTAMASAQEVAQAAASSIVEKLTGRAPGDIITAQAVEAAVKSEPS